MRKALAERVARTLRSAVREGVVPGGGLALMNVIPALEQKQNVTVEADERAAYSILIDALIAPMRTIADNAGYDPSEVMAKMSFAEAGQGFDVLTGRIVDMTESGILDCAAVQKMAVRNAVTTAALALTIDVLIHHHKPEVVGEPG
jgi:chaperonin GroEL